MTSSRTVTSPWSACSRSLSTTLQIVVCGLAVTCTSARAQETTSTTDGSPGEAATPPSGPIGAEAVVDNVTPGVDEEHPLVDDAAAESDRPETDTSVDDANADAPPGVEAPLDERPAAVDVPSPIVVVGSKETGETALSPRYLACRRLLIEEESPSLAEHCFTILAKEGGEDAKLAHDMAALSHELGAVERARGTTARENRALLGERLVLSGAPEGLIGGALSGAIYGFLGTATVQAALRTDVMPATPWLLGVPAMTMLVGGALGFGLGFVAKPGDASLVSSSSLVGIASGIALQSMLFWRNDDLREIPLRFLTPLGTGLLFTAAAAGMAPFVDVTPGDAALATSAALWVPVFGALIGVSVQAVANDFNLWVVDTTLDLSWAFGGLAATGLLAYLGVLALHPFVDVPRPATWLIEAGVLVGAVAYTAFIPLGTALLGPVTVGSYLYSPIPIGYTLAMGLGGSVGLAAALLAGHFVPGLDEVSAFLADSPLAVAPVVAPDPISPSRVAVSLALTGALPW